MSFFRALHAQVGTLCLLLGTLCLLLARLLRSPQAIVGHVACLPAVVTGDLSGLSVTRIDKSKLRLSIPNGHLPSFGLTLLKNVVCLIQGSWVVIAPIQEAVAQVGEVCLVFVIGTTNESDCKSLFICSYDVRV